MKITIEKMAQPMHVGDWHDAPLKWTVSGPAQEVQHFSTKKDARRFASLRRKAPDFNTASRQYVLEAFQ